MRKDEVSAGGQWLVDACTTEIRAHRLIFIVILGPMLAYVLPGFMFSVGLAFATTTSASFSGHEVADGSIWQTLPWIVGFVLPLPALVLGGVQEWRRMVRSDQSAQSTGMRLPALQGDQLRAAVERIWRQLGRDAASMPP